MLTMPACSKNLWMKMLNSCKESPEKSIRRKIYNIENIFIYWEKNELPGETQSALQDFFDRLFQEKAMLSHKRYMC